MEKKQSILFTISTFGHGKGGHFYSLHTIAEELSKQFDVTIINIGFQQSPILNSSLYKTYFLKFVGREFVKTLKKVKSICASQTPLVINAFDIESFVFSRFTGRKMGIPVFHTKCGGPNPKGYFPHINNLVLFSRENESFFQKSANYKPTNSFVIPNRVCSIAKNNDRINALIKKHGLDSDKNKVILRIARIGRHYKTSIEQGIQLTKWLNENSVQTKFLLLGEIQEQAVFKEITEIIDTQKLNDQVRIETNKEFTINASEILPIADIVIGSGRNFMEATSFNIPLLVTLNKQKFPLHVTPENFDQVFETNFSPRTKVDSYDEKKNLNSIFELLTGIKTKIDTKDWFEEHFSVQSGAIKYAKIYKESSTFPKEKFSVDLFKNMFYTILRFRKSQNSK